MVKKVKNKLWFLGIPISLPLGIFFAVIYIWVARFVRGFSIWDPDKLGPTKGIDFIIAFFIFIITILTVFLNNAYKYFIDGKRNFSPFDSTVLDLSPDKIKAQNHPVSKAYLSDAPDGLTIGRYKKLYVRIPFQESPEHLLLIGAPGSNKSTILENAIIYDFNVEENFHSGFIMDVKPELSRNSVYECDPRVRILNPSSLESIGFDVYAEFLAGSTDDDIKVLFETISRTLIVNPGGENSFFYLASQRILEACLLFGYRKGWDIVDSIVFAYSTPVPDLITEILEDEDMEKHPKIRNLVRPYADKDSDAAQDIAMTLQHDLAIFDTDSVQRFFSSKNDNRISAHALVEGITIFLAIPDTLLKSYSPVFRMVTQICLNHILSIEEWKKPWTKPIWFLIDEAGSIGKIPDLIDGALSRGRSKGLQVTLACQSFSQLEDTYGTSGATSILNCCKNTVVLSCNDSKTAKTLSDWCGTYRETKVSTSSKKGVLNGHSSENVSEEYRPCMEIADIKNLEKDFKVLGFARGDWFLVKKAPFYEIEELYDISKSVQGRNAKFYPDGQRDKTKHFHKEGISSKSVDVFNPKNWTKD